jgi:hypothetical protein
MNRLALQPRPVPCFSVVPSVDAILQVAGAYDREGSGNAISGDVSPGPTLSRGLHDSETLSSGRSLYWAGLELGI